jgi:hypothetical protein
MSKEYSRTDSTGSSDSGYSSSTSGSVNDLSSVVGHEEVVAKLNKTVTALQEDLVGVQGFITQELIKLASAHEGIIDINSREFVDLRKSLLESQPKEGFAVISVPATIAGIEEKMAKVLAKTDESDKELVSKRFVELKEQMNQFQQDMTKDLSSNESVEALVGERHANQIFFSKFPFFNLENGNLVPIFKDEKQAFVNQVTPHIKTLPTELTRALSLGSTIQKPEIIEKLDEEIVKNITHIFALDPANKKAPILDQAKLTPDNFKEFADIVNSAVGRVDKQALVTEVEKRLEENKRKAIISNLLKDMVAFVEKKQKFPADQKAKVSRLLSPALAQMESGYLKDHLDDLLAELTKSIIASRTFASKHIKDEVVVSSENLEAISKKMSGEYKKWQEQQKLAAESKLNQETEIVPNIQPDNPPTQPPIMRQKSRAAMSDVVVMPELKPADKADSQPVELTDILIEMPEKVASMLESGSIKLVPPDQPAILLAKTSTKSDPHLPKASETICSICGKAIGNVLTEKGAKITPEQREQIEEAVQSKLVTLDPQHLKDNRESIVNNLTKALAEQGRRSFWRRQYTIRPEKLADIATTQRDKIIQSSGKELTEKLWSHNVSESALGERLTTFILKSDGRNMKSDRLTKVPIEELVRIRNTSPKLFDEIVLLGSEDNKKQGKVVAPGKTPTLAISTKPHSLTP